MAYIGQSLTEGTRREYSYVATAGQTVFPAVYTVGAVDVHQNGILLPPSDYTATDGTTVVFATGCAVDDEVVIHCHNTFSVADAVSASAGGTFNGPVIANDGLTVDNDGATVLTVDRATSDGTIIDVQKGGSTVGSIGNRSTALFIDCAASTGAGLDLTQLAVLPRKDKALNNGDISLGEGGYRFKNLYLSGGVYLGGTGAANLLDDYEEGTWTPTVASGTVSSSYGRYTKIGNRVFVGIEIGGFSDVGSANALTVNNLPFTTGSGASEGSVGGSFSRYCSPIPSAAYTSSASTLLSFYVSGGTGAYYLTLHSHLTSTNARFYIHATYLAA